MVKLCLAISQVLAKPNSKPGFLIFENRLAFVEWRQVFIEVLIFQHFDVECYIQVETDALS